MHTLSIYTLAIALDHDQQKTMINISEILILAYLHCDLDLEGQIHILCPRIDYVHVYHYTYYQSMDWKISLYLVYITGVLWGGGSLLWKKVL